jgi:ParB family transcriptional regulator, chromosome partitioning protein
VPERAAFGLPASGGRPRGIGRGLDAILPGGSRAEEGLRELPLDLVRANEHQPRKEFDGESLLALAESIGARGVLQPIVVRALPGGTYELIAGERRLRAARMAGLGQIPAIVRDVGDGERLELALIENMAREDLNPVEEARACATLVEDLGITKEELARRLGRSRVAISNLVRLLALPDEALDLLATGELTEGHGRALLVCKDHEARRRLARAAATEGWTVRELERRAREGGDGGAAGARRPVVIHPDLEDALAAASDALTAALGREVTVRPRGDRFRVELELDDPADALELARRLGARER